MTMLIPILVLAGTGIGQWPETGVSRRLRSCTRATQSYRRIPTAALSRVLRGLLVMLLACVGYSLLGPAGGSGCFLLGLVLRRQWSERHRVRSSLESGRWLAAGIRALVTELRAGSHPAVAAETAAAESDAATGVALRSIAASQRLGGSAAAVAAAPPLHAGSDAARQLGQAWQLAQRHGLPLADVLTAMQRDVASRVRFASEVHAGMAGVRVSAILLTLLPGLGLVLGTVLGAQPARVLIGTPTGQLLLSAGCALLAAGLLWISRLTRKGARV